MPDIRDYHKASGMESKAVGLTGRLYFNTYQRRSRGRDLRRRRYSTTRWYRVKMDFKYRLVDAMNRFEGLVVWRKN